MYTIVYAVYWSVSNILPFLYFISHSDIYIHVLMYRLLYEKVHKCDFQDYFCSFHGTPACTWVQERIENALTQCAEIFASMLHVQSTERNAEKGSFSTNLDTDITWEKQGEFGGYRECSGISSFLGWEWLSGCRHVGDWGDKMASCIAQDITERRQWEKQKRVRELTEEDSEGDTLSMTPWFSMSGDSSARGKKDT